MAESNRIREEWRPWDDAEGRFAGRYEVSDLGRVRSLPRMATRKWRTRGGPHMMRVGGKIMQGFLRRGQSGRPMVVLLSLKSIDGHSHTVRLHRMVLEVFVGPCPDGMEGCHNNGDPSDNRLANLRWDTRESNRADMLEHGTITTPPVHFGESHPNSKLTMDAVKEIRAAPRKRGVATRLAKKFGISDTHVYRIRNGEGWDCG